MEIPQEFIDAKEALEDPLIDAGLNAGAAGDDFTTAEIDKQRRK